MKKLGFFVLGLVVLLVIAGLVVPHFFNPNQYKAKIASEFKTKTGYDINIKGDIKISILPLAKAYVQGVTISNGAKTLVEVDEITAYPKLLPLLSGNVEVSSIKVSKPKITVAKTTGGYSWQKVGSSGANGEVSESADVKKRGGDVSIGEVKIEDGEVYFDDQVKGKKYDVKNINITSSLASLQGPVSFDAKLKFNDVAVAAKGNVENFAGENADPKITFDGDVGGSKITFNGILSDGKFTAKSNDIGPLADMLGVAAEKQYAKLPVDVEANVSYSKNNVNLQNLKLLVGDSLGSGNLSLRSDGEINIKATLKFQKINLDQLMPQSAPKQAAQKTDAELLAEDSNTAENKPVIADVDISAAEVVYGGASYKNLALKAATENQEVTVQPFKVDLPGGGKAEIYGILSKDTKGRVFDGHINAASNNLREILKSMKVNVASINDNGLKNFLLDSDLIVTLRDRTRADLSKIALKLDDTVFNGSASLDTAKPIGIGLSGTINGIDLNRYLKPPAPKTQAPKGEANLSEVKPLDLSWLSNFPVRAALNLAVGSVTYGSDTYGNVRINGNASPGVLAFSQLTASSKKIQVAAKANVTAKAGQKPKIELQANIGRLDTADFIKPKNGGAEDAPSTAKQGKDRWSTTPLDLSFLKMLDVDLNANIASLTHGKFVFDNLSVAGYIDNGQLTLQNFNSGVFGGKINAKASVIGSAVPSVSLSFSASDIDAYKLATALSNNQRLQGKISVSSSFATSGINQLAMISNLKGNIALAANQLVIKGFDVDGFVKQITNINDPTAVLSIARTISGDDAVTYLNNVTGNIGCESGICRTQQGGIKISTASSGQGLLDGVADIVNWKMDMNAVFNLLIPGDTPKETPSLGLHIYGPIDAPKLDVNYDEIKRYLVQRGTKRLLKSNLIPDKYKALIPGQGEQAPANDNSAEQPQAEKSKKPKLGQQLLKGALQNFMGGQQ